MAALSLLGALAYVATSATPAAQAAHHKKHKRKRKHCHLVKRCRRHHRCKRVLKCRKKKRAQEVAPLPAYGGPEPAPSLFGLNTGTFDNVHSDYVNDFQTAKNLGARWLHLTGGSIHFDSGGTPNYSTMDDAVTRTRKLRMGVVMSLGGSPKACSGHPSDYETCPPLTDSQRAAYRTYLTGLLLHYRNDVDTYESWVEPNHSSFWPSGPNPAQYAKLLETQYSVFQTVNEHYGLHLKLLFAGPSDFGINGPDAVLPFTDAVLGDLGGQRAFDAVALHAYRFPPAAPGAELETRQVDGSWQQQDWPQQLEAYEQEFTNHGYGTPDVWLTEFGWPGDTNYQSDEKSECANSADPNCPQYYQSPALQSRDLEDAYQDLLTTPALSFVKAAFWFNMRDYNPQIESPDPDFYYHYGLLPYSYYTDGQQLKPAGSEWRSLAAQNPSR